MAVFSSPRLLPVLLWLGGPLVAVVPAALRAQVVQPGLPTVPVNAVTPASPAEVPAEQPNVRLNFINTSVVDILHFYEQLSGKHVIFDTSMQGQITIDASGVTRTEAMRIIEASLSLNGFTVILSEDNIIKALGLGKPARNNGLPIYSDLANLPDNEGIVTFLMHLRYLDPQETSGVLTQYIPPNNSTSFNPLKSANALLITDTARNVRRLVGLVSDLDQPASPVTEKFISLSRADATKAVEFLNGVFETKSSGGSTPGQPGGGSTSNGTNRRLIRRGNEDGSPVDIPGVVNNATGIAPNGLAILSGDQLIQGRITLTADVRTNRVHVVTSPINMPLVERLLAEYDADTPFATPVRRPLRFVSAGDMLPILVDALKEPGTEGGNSPTTNNNSTSSRPQQSNRSSSSGSSDSLFGNSSSSNGLNGLGGSSGSLNSSFGDDNNAPEVDTRPTEAIVGNNRLIADQRTNTIILLGGADAKSKVFEILDQLDVRTPQVIIRTVIGELSLDNNHELGFQYLLRSRRGSLLSQFNSGQLGVNTGTGTGVNTGTGTGTITNPGASPSGTTTTGSSALSTFSSLATGLGSSFTGVGGIIAIGKSLDLIVSALDSTDRFKTISNPMIVTSNNRRASILSGTSIAIAQNTLSSLTTVGTSAGISSTTGYIDVLLKLSVTPQVNSEKEVTLDISQQINSPAGTSNTVGGSSAPNINKRELRNYVTARNGETIILGGLITQSDNRTSSDIPYLSRIPLLGNLFKTNTRDASRSELIILMHPEVVNTAEAMASVREKEENRTYLGHDLEDQLLPTYPVRKALPVKKTTVSTAVYDDKLYPAAPARKATVVTRTSVDKTTTTTIQGR